MKKSSIIKIFLTVILAATFSMARAETNEEIFNKAKQKISGATSISADFTLKVDGESYSGKIKSKGKKFALTSNLSSTWYNGTDMWTYIPGNAETTVVKPTATELSEANPLLYVGNASNFNITKSKKEKSGTIVLVPKKSGSGIKTVTIEIDTKTYLPTRITVTPSSGSNMVLTLKNVKTNGTISDSEFSYPQKKYPNAKIIDLR